jgi:uncharacterized protein YutE (UPF0331/DUF86 family)
MVVNKDKVEQRLLKLEQTIRKLKVIGSYSWDEYKHDEGLKDRAERNLQLAAQACIDIANHIVADSGFRAPSSYGDAFIVLMEEGILPEDLTESMKMIAGFRNILVHDYLKIDDQSVYNSLSNLKDLTNFAWYIEKLL